MNVMKEYNAITVTYRTQQIGLQVELVTVVTSDLQELQVSRIGFSENTFGKTTIPGPPVKNYKRSQDWSKQSVLCTFVPSLVSNVYVCIFLIEMVLLLQQPNHKVIGYEVMIRIFLLTFLEIEIAIFSFSCYMIYV
jgi:hypothetical protein